MRNEGWDKSGQAHPCGTARFIIIAAILLIALVAGCGSNNTDKFATVLGPGNIVIGVPADIGAGVDASWSASWVDGYARIPIPGIFVAVLSPIQSRVRLMD